MKKIWGALFGLLLLSGVSAQAAYDSAKVQDVMQHNFGSLSAARKAIDATDSKAAAAAFQTIVDSDKALLGMNPPKGDKAVWDQMFTALIATAKKGADASTAGDWATAKSALSELRVEMAKGHEAFR